MSFTKHHCRKLTQKLSPREREVLRLMSDGLPTKAIAAELVIGERTVCTYRERIYHKLGVNAAAPAARVAWLAGLL